MKRIHVTAFLVFAVVLLYCTVSPAASGEWTCPKCNNATTGNYCNYCGAPRPEVEGILETTFSSSNPDTIGDATVSLKRGFDFIKTNSSEPNRDLALTALTLSAQIYPNARGDHTKEILYNLGYDDAAQLDTSYLTVPSVCFGYKRVKGGKNVFTVVVRGTYNTEDKFTDGIDGIFSMFKTSENNIREMLFTYMGEIARATGRTLEQIKGEDNYFFFTGHSYGGAVANCLSVDSFILEYTDNNKEKIYTYTFESPHTCKNLFGRNAESMSNALNYKVEGDAVTDYPAYRFSTTYGTDVSIKVSELKNNTFNRLFPDAKEKTLNKAVSVGGHGNMYGLHDVFLGLVYLMEDVDMDVAVDAANFPDEGFRMTVYSEFDKNKDTYLSPEEIKAVTEIFLPDTDIESLEGIEYFPELKYIEICSYSLPKLDCSSNPLLEELYCTASGLKNLNVKGCTNLKVLCCPTNELVKLDVSGCTQLETLCCEGNKLSFLNLKSCGALRYLSCEYNNLSGLNIGDCPSLIDVFRNGEEEELGEDFEETSRGMAVLSVFHSVESSDEYDEFGEYEKYLSFDSKIFVTTG